ncbi:MAG: transcription initiation factor IIB family protein [Candidatus Hodarchaeota archaeon]
MVIRKDANNNENIRRIDDIYDIDEVCCEEPDIFVTVDGKIVCRKCGMCFGPQMVGHERRAYTAEEVRSRRRTEPVWRCFGPRTVISTIKTDSKGRQLPARKQALFARLSKIQGSLISSIERNYWEAKPKLQALANKLGIPDYIVETAWKIYSEVARQKLTMGRSIQAFTCASLYAAIRIHNFPRLLEELTDSSSISIRSVHRSLGLIVRNVLPKLGLKYRPISPRPLVYRFGNELNLSIGVQQAAADLLKKASKRGLAKMGKDPKGLAAAALYMCAKKTKERKTQTQIAEVSRVTEVTLRTRAKQIKSCFKLEKD